MTSDIGRDLHRTHTELQSKYTYFLLAAAGAAIAFAVNQTQTVTLSASLIPLGIAVLAWGLSFYFGCRHVSETGGMLSVNFDLVNVQEGKHRLTGKHPELIQIASEKLREILEEQVDQSGWFSRWQFRTLIIGAVFFLGWHLTEMYLRTGAAST